jgi:hypothetical protein
VGDWAIRITIHNSHGVTEHAGKLCHSGDSAIGMRLTPGHSVIAVMLKLENKCKEFTETFGIMLAIRVTTTTTLL